MRTIHPEQIANALIYAPAWIAVALALALRQPAIVLAGAAWLVGATALAWLFEPALAQVMDDD